VRVPAVLIRVRPTRARAGSRKGEGSHCGKFIAASGDGNCADHHTTRTIIPRARSVAGDAQGGEGLGGSTVAGGVITRGGHMQRREQLATRGALFRRVRYRGYLPLMVCAAFLL
jgi:hypothetical protein